MNYELGEVGELGIVLDVGSGWLADASPGNAQRRIVCEVFVPRLKTESNGQWRGVIRGKVRGRRTDEAEDPSHLRHDCMPSDQWQDESTWEVKANLSASHKKQLRSMSCMLGKLARRHHREL